MAKARTKKRTKAPASSTEAKLPAPVVEVVEDETPIGVTEGGIPLFSPGRPPKYRPEFDQQLVTHMEQGLSFESFCVKVGVVPRTLYNWLEAHPTFLQAKELGTIACQHFFEVAARNASLGIQPAPPPGMIAVRPNMTGILFCLKIHGRHSGFNDGLVPWQPKAPVVGFEYEDIEPPAEEEADG